VDKLLSIAIVYYNRPNELKKTIQKCEKIDWPKEIIVLDNNSKINLKSFFKKNGLVRYFRSNKNIGAASGRNLLTSKANGEIILFLDDDSEFMSGSIKQVFKLFNKYKKLAILACSVKTKDNFTDVALKEEVDRDLFFVKYFIGCGFFANKKILLNHKFDDFYLYYFEEPDLSARLYKNDYFIATFDGLKVFHRVSSLGRHNNFSYIFFRNSIYFNIKNLVLKKAIFCSIKDLNFMFKKAIKSRDLSQIYYFFKVFFIIFINLPKLIVIREPVKHKFWID
jgi:GT2 family glycosyltransferase